MLGKNKAEKIILKSIKRALKGYFNQKINEADFVRLNLIGDKLLKLKITPEDFINNFKNHAYWGNSDLILAELKEYAEEL